MVAAQKSILLVEDEAIIAMNTAAMLRKEGYWVELAYNGSQAIEKVKAAPGTIDLILMDINLDPGMDGTKTAQEILKEHNIPILFLSSHTEPKIVEKTEKITSYGYVVKNSGITVLAASIKMAFKLHAAHQALQHTNEKLSLAQEASGAGTWDWDIVANTFAWSAEFLKLFGMPPGTVAGFESWTQALHPEDREIAGRRIREAIEHKIDLVNDYRIVMPNGEIRWIRATGKTYYASDRPVRMIGLCIDVTQHKQAEEALKVAMAETSQREAETEALLVGARAILEQEDFDLTARRLFAVCKDLIGATAGYVALLSSDGSENEILFLETGGLECSVDPDLPMPVRGLRGEAYRSGKAVYENNFRHSEWLQFIPAGHTGLDNVLFSPMVVNAKVYGLLGLANKPGGFTANDAHIATSFGELAAIALRNSWMVSQLRNTEAHFRRVLELSQTIVFDQDKDLRYTRLYNPGPGFTLEGTLGKTDQELLTPKDAERLTAIKRRVLETGQTIHMDVPVTNSGETLFYDLIAEPQLTSSGKICGITCASTDITARKRVEEALDRALKEKSTLLQDLQHRIKNSLTLISSLIVLERENQAVPEVKTVLNELYSRVNSLAALYSLLYESEDRRRVQLDLYLNRIASMLFTSFLSNRSDIHLNSGWDEIWMDARRAASLGLILNELLTNALKYAFPVGRSGEIQIILQADEDQLRLVVSDNGVGLPPGFDLQRPASLGLQIVQMLTKQISGTITCQQNGKTTFCVQAPLPHEPG